MTSYYDRPPFFSFFLGWSSRVGIVGSHSYFTAVAILVDFVSIFWWNQLWLFFISAYRMRSSEGNQETWRPTNSDGWNVYGEGACFWLDDDVCDWLSGNRAKKSALKNPRKQKVSRLDRFFFQTPPLPFLVTLSTVAFITCSTRNCEIHAERHSQTLF